MEAPAVVLLGWAVNASLLAAPGLMVKVLEVALVRPVAVAVRV